MEIKISDIINMIEEGKSRQEIAKHYGLPYSFMQANVFNHPLIKGKRKKKQQPEINLIEDVLASETFNNKSENSVPGTRPDQNEFENKSNF